MPITRLRGALLLTSGLCYLSWVLALLLDDGLSPLDSFASELAATGRPHAWLYRGGDLVAGALLAMAALLHLVERCSGVRVRGWAGLVPLLVLVFGVATVVDALLPMSCVETVDQACRARVSAGTVPLAHRVHLWASAVAGACCGVALLVQAHRAVANSEHRGRGEHRGTGEHRGLVALAVAWSLGTLWVLAAQMPGLRLPLVGLAQRGTLLLTSLWLGCWGWRLLRAQRTSRPVRSRSRSSASSEARHRSA